MSADNYYDDLVDAARGLQMLEVLRGWPYDELSGADSDEILQKNDAVLNQAQALLKLPARVPLEYDSDFYRAHMEGICALRDLSRLWTLQCDRARFKGQQEVAAQAVRNVLRLANVSRNGGLMTDLLVSNAIAGGALSRLRKMRHVMSADACARMALDLAAWDRDRESFREVAERDAEWERVVELTPSPSPPPLETPDDPALAEFHHVTKQAVQQMMELPPPVQQNMKEWLDHKTTSVVRLLAVDLALRALRASSAAPATLDALVPEYQPRIPENPFCKAPMVYRPLASEYKLYFLGPSGQDHQGRFGDWKSVEAGEADVSLDIDDFPLTLAPTTKHSPPWKAVGDKFLLAIHRLGARLLMDGKDGARGADSWS